MRQALGKGLDALIPEESMKPAPGRAGAETSIQKIPVGKIKSNRLQPRKRFDEEALKDLAESMKEHGLAQPILISKSPMDGEYELIAGERRLRAAQLAGFMDIDCIVRPALPNLERLAIALIENLQREDLNPIEEAVGFRRLAQDFNMTQAQVAQSVGKSRVAVANTMRLLELSIEIQAALEEGKITEGHGRALLMVVDAGKRHALFEAVLKHNLSVRQTEEAARIANDPLINKKILVKPVEIRSLESELQHVLGTKVEIRAGKDNRGRVVVHYFSLEDLDRILKLLKK